MSPASQTPRSPRSLARHGAALSLLTLGSRFLGLFREMTKASLLGTSALSDAFSVAFMIPNLFRRLFAEGSIAVAFIPTLKEYLVEDSQGLSDSRGPSESRDLSENRKKILEFISCIFTFLTFFVTLAVIAGILAAPAVVSLFNMEAFDETVFLTRLMFPFLGFISIAALLQGILNSVGVFAPSGFAPILLNLATILCAYGLSPFTQNPARAMAAGVLIGGFLEAAIQLPFVLKKGFPFFFTGLRRALRHPGTRKTLRLIGPTIVGMAAYQLNDLVSTALAGKAGEGIVSSLQYSLRIQELILGVFAVSIGTVLLPDLAEHAKSSQWETYNDRLATAMNIIALITIPITFFSLSQGEILIRFLFQSRSFDETSVALTLSAFTFHMPGIFFIAQNRILAPAFYAQSDSRSPTLAGLLSFAVNIALAALLAGPLKGAGIALALSLSSAVNTALLLIFLRRNPRIGLAQNLRPILAYAAKLILFSCLAALPVLVLSPRLLPHFAPHRRAGYGLLLAVNALVFAAAGIILLAATRDKQFREIMGMLGKKKPPKAP